jgi:hypothetical protein
MNVWLSFAGNKFCGLGNFLNRRESRHKNFGRNLAGHRYKRHFSSLSYSARNKTAKRGDQRSLWKNRQKFNPTHFYKKIICITFIG